MKIFHLITTLERGGAENQLVTLVREQIRDNNQVFVGYLKGKPELVTELEKMSATVLSEVSNLALILQIFKIRKIINKLEPDIIHAHLPRAELISSLIKGKTKLILSKHNSETFWPGVNARLSRYLSKFTLKRANKVICISQAVKNYLVSSGELPITLGEVVHYGYRLPDKILSDENWQRYENDNLIYIGTISRLVKQKDLGSLIKAFAQATLLYENLRLIIIGSGPLEKELKKMAFELNVSEKIVWFGRTDSSIYLLKKMKIFILSSLYEGFGLVLLESMAAQTPIIASNNSCILEVLGKDNIGLFETGNVTDLKNKILDLLKDSKKRNQMILDNSKRLEIFTPEAMWSNLKKIYLNV